MAKNVVLGDHQVLITRFRDALTGGHAVVQPFENASSLTVFRDAVETARQILPARYQKPYVDVLEQAVNQADKSLQALGSKSSAKRQTIMQQLEMVFAALAAPIVQLESKTHQAELKAFFSVISDVYRRFVDNTKVSKAAKTKIIFPLLDPLGAFGDDDSGNFTLAPSAELPVAIISKPAAQAQFLPLWLADGHEVGGHSVHTAVQDFQLQMTAAVEQAIRDGFQSGRIKTSVSEVKFQGAAGPSFIGRKSASMEDFMVEMWRKWLAEASADAAGLLNMGPMFANGLILMLVSDRPTQRLSAVSVLDTRGFVEHPIDVVRVLLTIEMLKRLKFAEANDYATALLKRLQDVQGGTLPSMFGWLNRSGKRVAEVSRNDMQAVLPVVAQALLETRLDSLSDQSLTDIMTWTALDEQHVRNTCGRLLKGRKSVAQEIGARHVVAASLLAMEKLSTHQQFDQHSKSVHDAGIFILASMYDRHCLLCNVQNLGNQPDTSAVRLVDLVRLVKHMRNR